VEVAAIRPVFFKKSRRDVLDSLELAIVSPFLCLLVRSHFLFQEGEIFPAIGSNIPVIAD
jgi:hypothetical protein